MPDLLVIPLGIAIGVLVSAPVGPVNILCINRTLRFGFWGGLSAGFGAVIGDGLIATVAGFGVTTVTEAVTHYDAVIQLFGGLILVVFGYVVTATAAPDTGPVPEFARLERGTPLGTAAGTFAMTVTNPGALLGMFAIFGGIIGQPMVPDGDYAAVGLLVLSVIGGALLWWMAISALVARLRHRFSSRAMRAINIVSGLMLMVFGFVVLGRLALAYLGWGGGAISP